MNVRQLQKWLNEQLESDRISPDTEVMVRWVDESELSFVVNTEPAMRVETERGDVVLDCSKGWP